MLPSPHTLYAIELGTMAYLEALDLQHRLVAAKKAGQIEAELLLLLEHPAVITLGRRGDGSNVVAPAETLAARGVAVHRVERGGDVTYHGPGQLVGYPIVSLRTLPKREDVGRFVWTMQEALIRTLACHGLHGERIEGVIGVWQRGEPPDVGRLARDAAHRAGLQRATGYPERKIAAIGARVESWISFHGFALNVTTDLDDFNMIVPCGLEDRGVTSMEAELGDAPDIAVVRRQVAEHLAELWGFELVWVGATDLESLIPPLQDTV